MPAAAIGITRRVNARGDCRRSLTSGAALVAAEREKGRATTGITARAVVTALLAGSGTSACSAVAGTAWPSAREPRRTGTENGTAQ